MWAEPDQAAPSPCDQSCLCLRGLRQQAESPDGWIESYICHSENQALMLLISSCAWLKGSSLGPYQCVPTADWDLGALLYLIHDHALLLSFTTHILLFIGILHVDLCKKKNKKKKLSIKGSWIEISQV